MFDGDAVHSENSLIAVVSGVPEMVRAAAKTKACNAGEVAGQDGGLGQRRAEQELVGLELGVEGHQSVSVAFGIRVSKHDNVVH